MFECEDKLTTRTSIQNRSATLRPRGGVRQAVITHNTMFGVIRCDRFTAEITHGFANERRFGPTVCAEPEVAFDNETTGHTAWREQKVYGGLNLCLHLPIVRTMQNNPRLTDKNALRRNRARANLTSGMFLHDAAIAEVQDRLSMVNRGFTRPAIVTGFAKPWRKCVPNVQPIPDTDVLEVEPQSHDLIIHGLGLHWADDPVGQIIQCRRALKDDGLFLAVTFGGKTLHELRASLAQAEVEITGGLSPRIAPMGEIRDLGALLQRSGLALPVADTVPLKVTYESPWALMKDLRAMGEGNALNDRIRHPTRRSVLIRASEIYVENFMENGRIPATFEMIFLTGWAPDVSQPKPLRPGSASNRLADALSTSEIKLPK